MAKKVGIFDKSDMSLSNFLPIVKFQKPSLLPLLVLRQKVFNLTIVGLMQDEIDFRIASLFVFEFT